MLKLRANNAITRFASVILSVLLLCAFVPFSTMAASANEDITVVTTAAEFTAALSSSNSIKLGADISVDGSTYVNHDLTIDFNGHTLTFTRSNAYGFFVYNNAKLTLVGDGTLNSYYCAIYAGSPTAGNGYIDLGVDDSVITVTSSHDNAIVFLNQDSKLTVGRNVFMDQQNDKSGIVLYNNANLDFSGVITVKDGFAISTNGNASVNSTVIIRNDAYITSESNVAIYQASGTYILEGGTITGGTGLYMRSGNLTVPADSTVTVKGLYDAGVTGSASGGAYNTGDALVIDNSDYPAGTPVVSVAGGTFDSVNALSVSSIASASGTTPVSSFISGGRFNKDPQSSYLVIGVHTVLNNGYYEVVPVTAQ